MVCLLDSYDMSHMICTISHEPRHDAMKSIPEQPSSIG